MDKRLQDIHYGNAKSMFNEIVIRAITIDVIYFKENTIHIKYKDCCETKTLVLPKLQGYTLTID